MQYDLEDYKKRTKLPRKLEVEPIMRHLAWVEHNHHDDEEPLLEARQMKLDKYANLAVQCKDWHKNGCKYYKLTHL